MFKNILYLFLACTTVSLLLSGCSSDSAPEPEAGDLVEVRPKSSSDIDLPEQELFTNAKRQYQNSLQSVSRESFKSLKNNFPTGPYSEFAEIKIADSLFENADYAEALKIYEDYTKNRPSSVAVPYALLKAGRSAELSSAGAGRDPNPFIKALALYNQLIENFPESIYVEAAKQRKLGVTEILAEYELQVISFYEQQGKDNIADLRRKDFKSNYKISAEDFEITGYNKRSAIEEKKISASELNEAQNYLRAISNKSLTDTQPEQTPPITDSEQTIEAGKFIVYSVVCNKDNSIATLYLEPKNHLLTSNLIVEHKSREMQLNVANLTTSNGKAQSYSCFSDGDLSISSTGTIKLFSDARELKAFFAENPSRLILSVQ